MAMKKVKITPVKSKVKSQKSKKPRYNPALAIELAKDVKRMVKAGRFYLIQQQFFDEDILPDENELQLKKFFKACPKNQAIHVCAVSAMIVAKVIKYDDFTVDDARCEQWETELAKIMPSDDVALMIRCFDAEEDTSNSPIQTVEEYFSQMDLITRVNEMMDIVIETGRFSPRLQPVALISKGFK